VILDTYAAEGVSSMTKPSQKKTAVLKSETRVRPKKRDRAASELRLIRAAEETFAKHGFAGTTTKLIAQKAKLNEALIARYFEGKMGLLFAVIRHHIKQMKGDLPYPPHATLEEEISAYVKNNYDLHCTDDEDFFRIVLSQALTDAKFAKRFREEIPVTVNIDLVARLNNFITAGEMRNDLNVEQFVRSLERQISSILLFERLLMDRKPEELDALLKHTSDIYSQLAKKT